MKKTLLILTLLSVVPVVTSACGRRGWERKNIGRMEEVEVGVGVARRLCKAVVEAASPATGNVRDDTVEDAAM